ncbi:hypothetical protein QQX98_012499 [Neonectria punicea]|uniref:Uncharacterized protein n=1 Tax=Neonectria punicea TaxID=979145 RepID=A0ABR1GJ38_9HYPO
MDDHADETAGNERSIDEVIQETLQTIRAEIEKGVRATLENEIRCELEAEIRAEAEQSMEYRQQELKAVLVTKSNENWSLFMKSQETIQSEYENQLERTKTVHKNQLEALWRQHLSAYEELKNELESTKARDMDGTLSLLRSIDNGVDDLMAALEVSPRSEDPDGQMDVDF